MKNLTKIFMAVAVALFAFSCVQDATEDLGVKVGGQTELTLSIEESRTQLGEKAGDVYPVTWCEGDVVAVNGVASTGIEIVGNGTSATFTFPEAIARPWSVVYPATTATPATAGLQAVTFLATQEYKAGTFCDGAAPMYGVAAAAAEGEEAPAVQLNHLTGVLRFAVKGAGEKLTALTVTTESGKIAGNFDVDCATGALTAHEDASNTITVTFGEGLTLGAEATPIYVAVPAGEYGVVTVVLATDDAKNMTAKFGSNGDKQIKAGVVREFAEFIFAENDIDNKWFEIYTVADMLAFAKTATNFPYVGAKVMASIDMTGVEWTPIEGFGKVFDGGNENALVEGDTGICISGLSAPLFGTTSATIQNLKLTGVNITETKEGFVGSIARVVEGGTVKNCKAVGTLLINNTTYKEELIDGYNNINIGGLVGRSVGATYFKCVNKVAVTVTSVCDPNSGKAYGTTAAGITGRVESKCSFEDCKNDAKILYNGESLPSTLYLSGIAGYADADYDSIHLKDLENTVNGTIEVAKDAVGKSINMRGCIGVVYDRQDVVENIVNNGTINFLGTANGEIRIAGVCNNVGGGYQTVKKLINNGTINISGTATTETNYVGGIASHTAGDVTHKIEECKNTGKILIDGTLSGKNLYCGGLFACNTNGTAQLKKCENSGAITISSTVSALYLSGVLAYTTKAASFTECKNSGAITYSGTASTTHIGAFMANSSQSSKATNVAWTDCENIGAITHSGTSSGIIAYGGFLGYADADTRATWTDCTNSGALSFTGHAKSNFFFGGYFGYPTAGAVLTWNNCVNKGAVSVTGKQTNSDDKKARVGGFAGGTYATCNFYSCTNEGAVTVNLSEVSAKVDVYSGGFVGDVESGWKIVFDKAEGSDKPCVNKGTITLSGACGDGGNVAGLVAGANHGTGDACLLNNAVNEGEIKCINATSTAVIRAAGLVGASDNAKSQITNATNTGNITVDNVSGSSVYVAGIAASISKGKAWNGTAKSKGSIKVSNVTAPKNYLVGGIVAYYTNTSQAIKNAQSVCEIQAIGLEEKSIVDGSSTYYHGLGMIVGSHRGETALVSGCKLGGKYALTADASGKPEWKTISADVVGSTNDEGEFKADPAYAPFWEKIYGGAWADAGIGNCDGCSYISKIE